MTALEAILVASNATLAVILLVGIAGIALYTFYKLRQIESTAIEAKDRAVTVGDYVLRDASDAIVALQEQVESMQARLSTMALQSDLLEDLEARADKADEEIKELRSSVALKSLHGRR